MLRGFVEGQADNLPAWIARAADLVLKAAEYVIPKLGRAELTGANGGPLIPVAPVLNMLLVGAPPPGPAVIDSNGVPNRGEAI